MIIDNKIIEYVIIVLSLIAGLYTVYLRSKVYNEPIFKTFDRYFYILGIGIIVSRVLYIFFNFSKFMDNVWHYSPYQKIENALSGEVIYLWFTTLPWSLIQIFDGGMIYIGLPIALWIVYFIIRRVKEAPRVYTSVISYGLFALLTTWGILSLIYSVITSGNIDKVSVYLNDLLNIISILITIISISGMLLLDTKLQKEEEIDLAQKSGIQRRRLTNF